MNKLIPPYYKRFHIPGMQAYAKRPKNAIYISPANGLNHELAKFVVAWMLKKGIDPVVMWSAWREPLVEMINAFDHDLTLMTKDWACEKPSGFITEAVENATNLRRDVVDYDKEKIYEIETSPERAKRFIGKDVNVLELWSND